MNKHINIILLSLIIFNCHHTQSGNKENLLDDKENFWKKITEKSLNTLPGAIALAVCLAGVVYFFPPSPDPKDLKLKKLAKEKQELEAQNALLQDKINEANKTTLSTLSTKLHPAEEDEAKTKTTLQEKLEGKKNPFLVPNRNLVNPIYLNQNYNIRASSCEKKTYINTFFEQNIHKKLPEKKMPSRITERTEFSPSRIWTSA